jgi:hypothetical protein
MSRNIIWLKQNYGDWSRTKSEATSDEELNDDEEVLNSPTRRDEVLSEPSIKIEVDNNFEMTEATPAEEDNEEELNPRTVQELKQLRGWFNPVTSNRITCSQTSKTSRGLRWENRSNRSSALTDDTDDQSGREEEVGTILIDRDELEFQLSLQNADLEIKTEIDYENMVEPKNFQEAWHHHNEHQREKGRKAIRKEFWDMKSRKVWNKIPRREIPPGRRCVKQKWVMKIKQNGIF